MGLFQRKPEVGQTYEHEKGLGMESRLRESLGGVRWDQAPVPSRRHQCWRQTRVVSRTRTSWRCACGAWSPDGDRWFNRNSRKRPSLLTRIGYWFVYGEDKPSR